MRMTKGILNVSLVWIVLSICLVKDFCAFKNIGDALFWAE